MDNKVMCPYCGKIMELNGSGMFGTMLECPGKGQSDEYDYWYVCDVCKAISPTAHSIEDAYASATNLVNKMPYLETIAAAVHNAWWEEKQKQGITDHPDMVPYDQLSEAAKEYDRATAKAVLRAIGGYVK